MSSTIKHLPCPLCHKSATYESNLRTHLKGSISAGGHELEGRELEDAVRRAIANSSGRPSTSSASPAASSSPAVVRRHEAAVVPVVSFPPAPLVPPPPVRASVPTPAPARTDSPFLEEVFRVLIENKALPKYQFERRVDVLLSVFLPEALSRLLEGDVRIVAPEFPIKKEGNNQSTNVDYVLFKHAEKPEDERWIFLELKTDRGSVDQDQVDIYQSAIRQGMPALLRDLNAIRAATKAKDKYDALLARFKGLPADRPIELIYLAPSGQMNLNLRGVGRALTMETLANLDLERYPAEWRLFRERVLRKI